MTQHDFATPLQNMDIGECTQDGLSANGSPEEEEAS
jgi:hypothetical protein